MKFMIFVIDQQSRSVSTNEIAEIDKFNETLVQGGHWIMAAGLADPSRAQVIDNRSNIEEIKQGSLFEEDSFYSGFWIIQAETEVEAKRLALAGSKACNRAVELRPFLG